jgi:hypothetical protein
MFQNDVLVGYLDPVPLAEHQQQAAVLGQSCSIRLHSVAHFYGAVR